MAAPRRDPYPEGGDACPAAIVFGLPEKLKGNSPVNERTELLTSYHEVFLDLFVGQAEASLKLAEQLSAARRRRPTGARSSYQAGEDGRRRARCGPAHARSALN
jgi:hypothetical protein